jgi:hypothetical protein
MAVTANLTAGSILTASQVNTYMINSGLVYLSTTTITASGQNIPNAFNDSYTNYLIVCNEFVTSATNAIVGFRLGSSTTRTEYSYGGTNVNTSSGGISADYSAAATSAFIGYTKGVPGGNQSYIFNLLGPQTATRKTWSTTWGNGQYLGQTSGVDSLASAQTDINFIVGSGSLTGGTVTIYGYRKA